MTILKSRFTYMILVGVVIAWLMHFAIFNFDRTEYLLLDFLPSIIVTIIVWQGNLWIDQWIDKYYPWIKQPGKRIIVHALFSVVYSTVIIYLSILAFHQFICTIRDTPLYDKDKNAVIATSLIIGVLVSIIILSVELGTRFFKQWKDSLLDVEKYKNESLQANLQNLKNQINPHFLFNNFSVLSSLVYQNQDKAVEFINQLSKVYRYLLDNRNHELISLETELDFVHSYTYLLKIRFDKNIHFDFQIEDITKSYLLPPMALQILIENAIKHNEVSSENPLTVLIISHTDYILVSNNLQLRKTMEPSSKTGLKNIQERYKYFTEKQVEIYQKENTFEVKIPLILESKSK
ncbi:MAG: histidine kinase [Bacteroidota bacterium]